MAAELAQVDNDEDSGLNDRQVAALEKLHKLGAEPRKSPDDKYNSNAQIRALQMVFEGILGGPGRGQGRKRKPRVGQYVAEELRSKDGDKIVRAIRAGLESEKAKERLDAASLAVRIDREEAALDLKQEQADDNMTKEDLIAALIELAGDATTQAAVEAADIDLPESSIEEVSSGGTDDVEDAIVVVEEAPTRTAARASSSGSHARQARGDGRAAASRDRSEPKSALAAFASRRSANR